MKARHSVLKTALSYMLISIVTIANAQITIESCQEKARANYPLIKQYDLIAKSLEYNLSNAGKGYLPHVSLTGIGAYIISGLPTISLPGSPAAEPDNMKFIGIGQLNQPIWDGGATKSMKEITRANSDVEKSNVDVSMYAIRERVNQLFFGVLVIDEQFKNLESINETLSLNLKRLQLSRDNGIAYQTDVDEVRAEMLNVEQKKIEFNYTRKGFVEMLSYITGQVLPENVQLVKPETPENVYETNQRPELILFANQMKLITARSAMNRVGNMPKVGILGAGILISPGAAFATSTVSSIAIAGLNLSWNTDNIYKSSNNKQLDKIQLDQVSTQQATFVFNNNMQLKQSNLEIEKQKAILKNDDEIVALKVNIRKSYQIKYDNGMSSMTELINSANKENEALSNRGLHQVQLLMNLYNYSQINGN